MSTASSQQPDIVRNNAGAAHEPLPASKLVRESCISDFISTFDSQPNKKLSNEIFEIENSRNTSSEKQKTKLDMVKLKLFFSFSFFYWACYWDSFGVVSQDVGKRENVDRDWRRRLKKINGRRWKFWGGLKAKMNDKEKKASSRSTAAAAGIIYTTASGLHRMWVRSEGPRANKTQKKTEKKNLGR